MAKTRSSLTLAILLGALALLPFIAGVYYAYAGTSLDARAALRWLLPYLATIVAFIGGAQWGRMLAQPRAPALDMALAVTPALIAWGALLTANPWRFALLLFALIAAWLLDENGARRGWQRRGFLQLRRVLTLAVATCIVVIGWRVMRA